jgi:site-specific DNA-methyltransferase (adenine-specific)
MKNNPLPRLDADTEARNALLPFCRLKAGDIWEDTLTGHRVGCLDASSPGQIDDLMAGHEATLAIHDPPYNLVAFDERPLEQFVDWCAGWVNNTERILSSNASLYVWLGADQNDGFQPLPDFMMMMRLQSFRPRSFITMRNQRGYGTQKNWMAVRQELLYYVKGQPTFHVDAEYTDIPKILRGYYKDVGGQLTENLERSKSENIRAGNVWVDVQQVFYRMEENVSGCYAQKPMKSIDRIVRASSDAGDTIVDFFSHSGTTLLAAEINKRRCFTMDIDPLFCEITIRRLEHFRRTGRTGWQNGHSFENEYVCPVQDAWQREDSIVAKPHVAQPSLF